MMYQHICGPNEVFDDNYTVSSPEVTAVIGSVNHSSYARRSSSIYTIESAVPCRTLPFILELSDQIEENELPTYEEATRIRTKSCII